jgi:uncharacterized protein (TIGR04141 family)
LSDDKKILNLTIFLMKDDDEFESYLKDSRKCSISQIKSSYGLDGIVCYPETTSKEPKWKEHVENLSAGSIDISDNSSNKAAILVKISGKVLALVFGYGRALLKENLIERNFGLRVSLNIIDPQKMKSVQAATVEDMVVSTQRQASNSVAQEEFGLNIENDIMRGVTGVPQESHYGKTITGKDSLVVAVFMNLDELNEKLKLYLSAYQMETYKSKGFEWVDNVKEVRDEILKEDLDFELVEALINNDMSNLHIAPAEIVDWEKLTGFCFSGIGKKSDMAENYTIEIDFSEYMAKLDKEQNVYAKIKRDKLLAMTSTEEVYSTGSVYNSLIFQVTYEERTYILVSGNWYLIDNDFYTRVYSYVKDRIPTASLQLPSCYIGETEGAYNKRVSTNSKIYSLMDCKLNSVTGGKKQIEACDLFTSEKQFVHVKNKGASAQLSHLFSQGKISAQCFVSDLEFRKQVHAKVKNVLGAGIFKYKEKPTSNEYEVVYAIIDSNDKPICDSLPFFSLLNLMLSAQELERMHIKCSVVKIPRVPKTTG